MSFETGPRDVSKRDPPGGSRSEHSAVTLLGVPADATATLRAADLWKGLLFL